MDTVRAIRGVVRGRVQGVAYRASFLREARSRGLVGWVRNRADGAVEFLVQGDGDRVDEVVLWAGHGPTLARVTQVTTHAASLDPDLVELEIR